MDPSTWTQGALIGDYVLEGRLGKGGMGTVHLGRHTKTGSLHALKALGALDDEQAVRRFLREGEALARIEHPHVVRVHSLFRAAGALVLAMEHCAGGDLEERLRAGGGVLPPEEAAALARDLALGLAAAHAKGVLHRDLKPANVLFDAEGRAKLSDFGLARVADRQSLTQSGALLGTPAYMAPEQAQGLPADERADVYGLGALLYRALGGAPPHDGPSLLVLLDRVAHQPPRPLRELAPVPPALAALVSRALARDPQERTASARALAEELERYLAGEARGPGPRWRPLAVAGVACVVLVGLGVAWRAPREPSSAPTLATPDATTASSPSPSAIEAQPEGNATPFSLALFPEAAEVRWHPRRPGEVWRALRAEVPALALLARQAAGRRLLERTSKRLLEADADLARPQPSARLRGALDLFVAAERGDARAWPLLAARFAATPPEPLPLLHDPRLGELLLLTLVPLGHAGLAANGLHDLGRLELERAARVLERDLTPRGLDAGRRAAVEAAWGALRARFLALRAAPLASPWARGAPLDEGKEMRQWRLRRAVADLAATRWSLLLALREAARPHLTEATDADLLRQAPGNPSGAGGVEGRPALLALTLRIGQESAIASLAARYHQEDPALERALLHLGIELGNQTARRLCAAALSRLASTPEEQEVWRGLVRDEPDAAAWARYWRWEERDRVAAGERPLPGSGVPAPAEDESLELPATFAELDARRRRAQAEQDATRRRGVARLLARDATLRLLVRRASWIPLDSRAPEHALLLQTVYALGGDELKSALYLALGGEERAALLKDRDRIPQGAVDVKDRALALRLALLRAIEGHATSARRVARSLHGLGLEGAQAFDSLAYHLGDQWVEDAEPGQRLAPQEALDEARRVVRRLAAPGVLAPGGPLPLGAAQVDVPARLRVVVREHLLAEPLLRAAYLGERGAPPLGPAGDAPGRTVGLSLRWALEASERPKDAVHFLLQAAELFLDGGQRSEPAAASAISLAFAAVVASARPAALPRLARVVRRCAGEPAQELADLLEQLAAGSSRDWPRFWREYERARRDAGLVHALGPEDD
ncbi:MAG: protein kinase [Planctomycetota bacterium]